MWNSVKTSEKAKERKELSLTYQGLVLDAKKRLLHSSSEHEYAYDEKADKKEPRLLCTISLEP